MTADRRYPHMHPIDGRTLPGLDPLDSHEVTLWASGLGRRATLYPWWNANTQQVHFCLRPECDVAVDALKVFGASGILKLADADMVVKRLYAGRKPAVKKDLEAEQQRRDEKSAADAAWHRENDHSRVERMKDARRLLRIRESGGLSRPMVTV